MNGRGRVVLTATGLANMPCVIILEMIRVKTETEISDEPARFRQGRGTIDQITNLGVGVELWLCWCVCR